jgi:hypothetical protein
VLRPRPEQAPTSPAGEYLEGPLFREVLPDQAAPAAAQTGRAP